MPTARELLEQADALMRRNRAADVEMPILTEAVGDEGAPPPVSRAPSAPADDALADDVPVLTEAVEEIAVEISLPPGHAETEPIWLGPDTIDPALHSITGPAPDTLARVPEVTRTGLSHEAPAPAEPGPAATSTERETDSAPPPTAAPSPRETIEAEATPAAATPATEEQWRALAEQISMQVLQRIDLFTDSGLKAQLAAHLQPIVARASAELVQAINNHVGELIRSYVAEAIEREIAQWRESNR